MSDSDRLSPLLSLQWMENLGTLCEPLPGHSSLFLPAIQGECWTYRMGSQSQSMATTVKIGEGGVGPLGIFRHSERQGVIRGGSHSGDELGSGVQLSGVFILAPPLLA